MQRAAAVGADISPLCSLPPSFTLTGEWSEGQRKVLPLSIRSKDIRVRLRDRPGGNSIARTSVPGVRKRF